MFKLSDPSMPRTAKPKPLRATDLMTTSPTSLRLDQNLDEAATLLAQRRLESAPVINESGRPVGFVTHTEVRRHQRPLRDRWREVEDQPGLTPGPLVMRAVHPISVGPTTVQKVMSADVACVHSETSAMSVAERMLQCRLRRIYVVDPHGVLIGLITPWDLLRLTET